MGDSQDRRRCWSFHFVPVAGFTGARLGPDGKVPGTGSLQRRPRFFGGVHGLGTGAQGNGWQTYSVESVLLLLKTKGLISAIFCQTVDWCIASETEGQVG